MKVEVGKKYRFVGDEGVGRLSDEVVTIVLDEDGNLAFFTKHDRETGAQGPWCAEKDGLVHYVGHLEELA